MPTSQGFLDEARRILKGRDKLVEFFVNREEARGIIRLEIWRSIAASAVYLSEKTFRTPVISTASYVGNSTRGATLTVFADTLCVARIQEGKRSCLGLFAKR